MENYSSLCKNFDFVRLELEKSTLPDYTGSYVGNREDALREVEDSSGGAKSLRCPV